MQSQEPDPVEEKQEDLLLESRCKNRENIDAQLGEQINWPSRETVQDMSGLFKAISAVIRLFSMRKWILFFLVSATILGVTYIAYDVPITLGTMCILMFAGLILFDLSDTSEGGRQQLVSNADVVRGSLENRTIRERNRGKNDRSGSAINGMNAQKFDAMELQMEHEAHCLLSFYIWYLLANTRELTFDEMTEKVNWKFRGLLSKEDVAKALVDNASLGGNPFFNCDRKGLKNRITHFLHYTLKKRSISLECSSSKADNVVDLLYHLEKRRQRISDIELKTMMNPRLKYKANRDSAWWNIYQRKMDRGLYLARLNNLFPDKESRRIYE